MKKIILLTICAFLLSPFFVHASLVNVSKTTRISSGLVGYWTFDGKDVVNGVVRDVSGNGNHGSLINIATTTFYQSGKIGQGFNFDGVNDYINAGSDFIGTSAGTYSAWIKVRSEGENSLGSIIDNRKLLFGMGQCAGTRRIYLSSNTGSTNACSANNAITYNTWQFVAATRDASGVANIYIDGVLSGTANQSSGTPAPGTQNVDIGNTIFESRTWDGLLDDVRVYNRALSAAEITALYNLGKEAGKINTTLPVKKTTNGLVGWWTFDGPDMLTNVKDKSGQNNNGSMINFAATSTVIKPGKIGQGLNFDGVNDYVKSRTTTLITLLDQPHSMFAWVYPKTVSTAQGIVNFGEFDDASRGTALGINASGQLVQVLSSFSDTVDSSLTVPANQWSFVGFSRTASTITFFVNGTSQVVASSRANGVDTNDPILVGAIASNATVINYFSGAIDDVRVYNRALSATEVTALYNQGLALTANASGATRQKTALSGLWTMNGPDLTTTTATDKAGVNNGTLNNFPTPLRLAAGKTGQALIFDGVDDNISLGDTNESGTITLAAWVKPSEQKTGMKIVSKKMSGASSQYGLATHGSSADKFTAVFFSSAPSSDVCDSTGTPGSYAANQWVFVAATYDGDTCKMYVNGADVTTVSSDVASGNILNTSSALRIGADGGASIAAGSYFRGTIDDVRIYSTALTAAQIYTLYNLGR